MIPAPCFIPNIFRYKKFFETQKGSTTKASVSLRQTEIERKTWHNPFKHKPSRYPKLMTLWRVTLGTFSSLWDKKNFEGNSWYFPPPLIHKKFRWWKFSETQHRRFPLRSFSVARDRKFFNSKTWHNTLKHKVFRYPNLLTKKVTLWIFWHCGTKTIWQKIVTLPPSPPLLSLNVLYTRIFVKHERVPLRIFWTLWDRKFSTENFNTLLSLPYS